MTGIFVKINHEHHFCHNRLSIFCFKYTGFFNTTIHDINTVHKTINMAKKIPNINKLQEI